MIELNVPDMTCGHCAKVIRGAVGRVDPAAACDIDLEGKRVKVHSALPPSDFVEALEDVGYAAVVAKAVG
jgi:copper chaperone